MHWYGGGFVPVLLYALAGAVSPPTNGFLLLSGANFLLLDPSYFLLLAL